jgi:hypothetical protein
MDDTGNIHPSSSVHLSARHVYTIAAVLFITTGLAFLITSFQSCILVRFSFWCPQPTERKIPGPPYRRCFCISRQTMDPAGCWSFIMASGKSWFCLMVERYGVSNNGHKGWVRTCLYQNSHQQLLSYRFTPQVPSLSHDSHWTQSSPFCSSASSSTQQASPYINLSIFGKENFECAQLNIKHPALIGVSERDFRSSHWPF